MTNSVNATELNKVETAVAVFDKNFKDPVVLDIKNINGQISALQDKSRDRTYDMVGGLVDLAEFLDVENPTEGYSSFLVKRAIHKPADGQNPYMAFIKAVFSVKLNGVWVFGKEQRSYEKHANHVRFLVNAKRKGLITSGYRDFIHSYPEKLKGIEAQDRLDNPNAAQQKRVKKVRDAGRTAAPRATINETFSGKDGDLLKVYGRVANGQLELLYGEVVNDNQKDSVLYKIGYEAEKALKA